MQSIVTDDPMLLPGLRIDPLRLLAGCRKQLLPNGLTEDWELEAPTAANRALGLMSIPRAAVAQKDRCHLMGHLRMPRAR